MLPGNASCDVQLNSLAQIHINVIRCLTCPLIRIRVQKKNPSLSCLHLPISLLLGSAALFLIGQPWPAVHVCCPSTIGVTVFVSTDNRCDCLCPPPAILVALAQLGPLHLAETPSLADILW